MGLRRFLPLIFLALSFMPARAGGGCCAIDTNRTFVIESRHMMHMVFIATSVDWKGTKKERQPAVKARLMAEVRKKSCQVLKSTNTHFKYIKHNDGYIDIEMRDKRDRRIGSARVMWTSC